MACSPPPLNPPLGVVGYLQAAVTTYAVQATPRRDKTVRLALLQAAISIGVFAAYLCSYYLPANNHEEITNVFLGFTVLGILDIIFALAFLSSTPGTSVTTTTTTNTLPTPNTRPDTQVIGSNSTLSLDRHAQRDEEEDEPERHTAGESEGEGMAGAMKKEDDESNENEVKQEERYAQREMGKEEEEERHAGDHEEGIVNATKEDKCYESEGREKEEEKRDDGECDENREREEEEEKEEDDECDENGEREKEGVKGEDGECDANEEREEKKEDVLNVSRIKEAESNLAHPIIPIDIFVIPPIEEEEEEGDQNYMKENLEENKVMEDKEIHQAERHSTAYHSEEEKQWKGKIKHSRLTSHGSSLSYHTITIASEDDGSVYGTPPEHSSRYGTPPSQAISRHSLQAAVAAEGGDQQATSTRHHPPHAYVPSYCHHEMQDDFLHYRHPTHHGTELSSSAPSTFPCAINARSHETPHIFLNEAQFRYSPKGSNCNHDSLTSLNVLLTPDSSLCCSLSYHGSNTSCSSSSEGCPHCHDVLREEEGYKLGAYACRDDTHSLSLPLSSNGDTTSFSNNPNSTTSQPEFPQTTQNESMDEVSEGAGDRSLAPLTLANESSGEGVCCAGGAGRCRVCVAGGLLCRPVSVTFRRRAAGLRGIVVADVVAAFFISVVAAAVWEVTPLYLEAKPKGSLANWIPYLACRSGLEVVALVVLLPLLRQYCLLQDTTLGVLGGISSFTSSVLFSLYTSITDVLPFVLIFGPLTQYLNVASASILVRLVGVSELGGVLMCLGTVEQLGQLAGWFTFHSIFPLLLRCSMPGVTFISTGFLVVVPSTILGSQSTIDTAERGKALRRGLICICSVLFYGCCTSRWLYDTGFSQGIIPVAKLRPLEAPASNAHRDSSELGRNTR